MGFMSFISPAFAIFNAIRGGGKDKDKQQAAPKTIAKKAETGTPEKSAEEIREDKRKKIVAANAGTNQPSSPLSNKEEDVTSKSLLGL